MAATKYKDSGIPWIGDIPSDWEVNKINQLFSIIGSGTTPKANNDSNFVGNINWIQSGDINGGFIVDCKNKISEQVLSQYSALKLYKQPFIIVAMYGASVGNISISKIDGCVNQACCVMGKSNQCFEFLFYAIKSAKDYLIYRAEGGGQPNISQDKLKNLRIPLPPLATQQRIADYLDRKCAEIDELADLQQTMIDELKRYKQSVITEAVTKGLNPNVKMKDSGVEWIGEIPEGWNFAPLKYFLKKTDNNLRVGPFGSALSGNDFKTEGIWVYNQRSVLDNNFCTNDTFIDKTKYESLKSFAVFPDDVLITTRGSIGKIAIVPNDAPIGIIHPCIIRFMIDFHKICPSILKHIFNESNFVLEQMRIKSNSTTIDVLYSYSLKNIVLPLIPLAEQRAIASYLDEKCAEIDELISVKQQKIESLKEYKKSVIFEYVTGKKIL